MDGKFGLKDAQSVSAIVGVKPVPASEGEFNGQRVLQFSTTSTVICVCHGLGLSSVALKLCDRGFYKTRSAAHSGAVASSLRANAGKWLAGTAGYK